jgi:glycosyltransferase involved in cell wall biosynthesis
MKLKNSLVSVIIQAHNAESHIARCLESILGSSYETLEVIVIDDGSKDKTLKVVKDFKEHDERIRVYKNKKRYGPAISFNRGLRRARGQFLTFMNAHDYVSPGKIQKQVSYLLKTPKLVAVGTQAVLTDENGKKLKKTNFPTLHEAIYQGLLHGIPMRFESALINRSLLPKDLIKFTTNTYPFIYTNVFMQMVQFGKLANLKYNLYFHRTLQKSSYHLQAKPALVMSFATQLVKSVYDHEYRPSTTLLVKSTLRAVRSINLPRPRFTPRFRSA